MSFENILKLSFNHSLLDMALLFYVLFKKIFCKTSLISLYSDLDFWGRRLKPVSDCQNFVPLCPKSSISNQQLNSQSECRIQ